MEYSFQDVKNIFDTLPIGFYLGSGNVDVVLDTKNDTSCYNVERNVINISYPEINKQLKDLDNYNIDLEQLVRATVYHELSHVILTPKHLPDHICGWSTQDRDSLFHKVNVMEDERIEQIMRDFYLNVDFKKAIQLLCESQKLDFTNPDILKGDTGYWLVVRLGIGTPEMQKDLKDILLRYWDMNNYSPRNEYVGYRNKEGVFVQYKDYVKDIEYFYEKYFGNNAKPQSQEQQQQMLEQLQKMMQGGEGNSNTEIQQGTKGAEEQEQANANSKEIPDHRTGLPCPSREEMQQNIQTMISQSLDGKLLQQLSQIFERTTIVEKMTSGATNGYSGVFNPRAVVRKDYKYFIHQDNKGDSKGFSKLHLNLFIDVSGSFANNQKVTNKLLHCLSRIEKDNPNFSYDLITICDYVTLKKPSEKYIICGGGTQIPTKITDLYHKAYKYDCVNYNLILFDGDCVCGARHEEKSRQLKNFINTFDTKLTTIISDYDNKQYFDNFKTAKVIYSSNYVEELTKNVIEVLKVAFM